MPSVLLFEYSDDNDLALNVELTQGRATAGAFPAGDNANGPPVKIHGKFLKLRGCWGKNGTKRMFLPCATKTQLETVFSNGSFTVSGTTYTVTGKRGEQQSTATPGT